MDNLKLRQGRSKKVEVAVLETVDGRSVSWSVECQGSCNRGDELHTVSLDRVSNLFSCDCPGAFYGHVCVHILAVCNFEVKRLGRSVSFWKTLDDVKRQHRKHFAIRLNPASLLFATLR